MNLTDKRVLLTGGSSGIGLAAAEALAAAGARLVISGRRPEALSQAVARLRAGGGQVEGVAADLATPAGREATLNKALECLGGLDILINNAGGVRAGRLEHTSEDEISTMLTVDLLAPILLTRAALPALRASGEAMVVNVASGIALIGMPFYTTYAAVKAGLSHFGEALRRELNGEGIQVMTLYPGATDTPMMGSSRAGPDLGFNKESPGAVAEAMIAGMQQGALQVIRGGEARAAMIAMNRENPRALDQRFLGMKADLEEAVRDHSAL
ncbi:oxidoreductase [Alcanivorax sp. N3-2A]|nr:oxidoreductase [Alcanivorax sp. N3-2A]|tara:strand:- start:73 stop:879 length:807 start_codon:yes stop_codon:yes gene_type:complete